MLDGPFVSEKKLSRRKKKLSVEAMAPPKTDKAEKPKAARKPAAHPSYNEMVTTAIRP